MPQFNNILPHDIASEENSMRFFIRGMLNSDSHIVLCYVTGIYSEIGDTDTMPKSGSVHAMPIIKGSLPDGTPVSNVEVKNIPYLRTQSGKSAFIADPQLNDVGILLVSDKDMSGISEAAQATAGSSSSFDIADSIYLGSVPMFNKAKSGTPTEYIELTNGGGITVKTPSTLSVDSTKKITIDGDADIEVTAGSSITLTAPSGLTIKGDTTIDGNVTTTGTIEASGEVTGNGIALSSHVHSGVESGSSETGQPS